MTGEKGRSEGMKKGGISERIKIEREKRASEGEKQETNGERRGRKN